MEIVAEDEEINVSELPQSPGWSPSLPLYNYRGFWYPQQTLKGMVLFRKNFIPQNSDIFLCTTPKCGTTWLKALCFAILTRNEYMNGDSYWDSGSPLLSKSPHDLVPFIERLFGMGRTRDPQNPLISTHVPFSFLPKSILSSNYRIIYICRDPKDVLVSYFFFVSTHFDFLPFETVYEMFCDGISHSGPYWDHVLGYWKASLEFPGKILFLRYEDLKSNICFHTKKIAEFMGCGFSIEEENIGTVEKIVRLCSFENLSNTSTNRSKQNDEIRFFSNASYFRKGEIGDWKNYLTPEMAERMDQITYQKFNAYGLNV